MALSQRSMAPEEIEVMSFFVLLLFNIFQLSTPKYKFMGLECYSMSKVKARGVRNLQSLNVSKTVNI